MGKINLKVAVGRQVFSPVQFHTIEVGEFTASVEADTLEEANALAERAYVDLHRLQDAAFEDALAKFVERAVEVKTTMGGEVALRRR